MMTVLSHVTCVTEADGSTAKVGSLLDSKVASPIMPCIVYIICKHLLCQIKLIIGK